MTKRQRNRLIFIIGGFVTLWVAAFILLGVLNESIVFSYGPTDIIEKHIKPGQNIRLAGLVTEGSVKREAGLRIEFVVNDGKSSLPVVYTGVVPDLFGEKQGVIAEGQIDAAGVFRAETVLAKHDEKYMPREVVDALKKQGVWQGEKPQTKTQPQTQTQMPPEKAASQ